MKVILRTEIEKLGKIGDVVSVKPGYARNYLVPQGHAYVADKGNLRRFEEEKRQLLARADNERTRAEALKERIEERNYTIEVKTGEKGRLYGSVTSQNIAELLDRAGFEVDKRRVVLEQPIKSLGLFEVPVKLYGDVQAVAKVFVLDAEAHLHEAEGEGAGEGSAEAKSEESAPEAPGAEVAAAEAEAAPGDTAEAERAAGESEAEGEK